MNADEKAAEEAERISKTGVQWALAQAKKIAMLLAQIPIKIFRHFHSIYRVGNVSMNALKSTHDATIALEIDKNTYDRMAQEAKMKNFAVHLDMKKVTLDALKAQKVDLAEDVDFAKKGLPELEAKVETAQKEYDKIKNDPEISVEYRDEKKMALENVKQDLQAKKTEVAALQQKVDDLDARIEKVASSKDQMEVHYFVHYRGRDAQGMQEALKDIVAANEKEADAATRQERRQQTESAREDESTEKNESAEQEQPLEKMKSEKYELSNEAVKETWENYAKQHNVEITFEKREIGVDAMKNGVNAQNSLLTLKKNELAEMQSRFNEIKRQYDSLVTDHPGEAAPLAEQMNSLAAEMTTAQKNIDEMSQKISLTERDIENAVSAGKNTVTREYAVIKAPDKETINKMVESMKKEKISQDKRTAEQTKFTDQLKSAKQTIKADHVEGRMPIKDEGRAR